jgi:hypothetical protein
VRWEQGRAEVEQMLSARQLQRVPASRAHADRLMGQSARHLASAQSTAESDPEGAYSLLYDAARKSLWAVLENEGLRPTTAGGHLAAFDATRAQLDPPMGGTLRPFDRMRRHRRDAEYPSADTPQLSSSDVADDFAKVEAIVRLAAGVLDQMSPF